MRLVSLVNYYLCKLGDATDAEIASFRILENLCTQNGRLQPDANVAFIAYTIPLDSNGISRAAVPSPTMRR